MVHKSISSSSTAPSTDKTINVSGSGYNKKGEFSENPKNIELLLRIGALCNDSKINFEKDECIGDPTEGCLIVSAEKGGLSIDSEPTLPQTIACSSSIECIKRGFDCCNDGSCINGGTLKFNAELLPEYNLAMSDITINPLAYKKYPEIFYICQETEITGDASEVRLDRHATWGEIQSDASKVCKEKVGSVGLLNRLISGQ